METIIVTGPITHTTSMRSSKWGNPRHQVTFASGETYPTEPDANVAYGINNREYREAASLQVTLNGRDNIAYIKILEG